MKRLWIAFLLVVIAAACLGVHPVAAQSPCGETYTVQRGDYLTKIARACDVRLADLMNANPSIRNWNLIYPGQVLNIPDGTPPPTGGSIYIVQPGDTLRKIAARFQVTLAALIAANPQISNPNIIYAGQQVKLPEGSTQIPTASIAPATGKPGSTVTLAATGFRAAITVEIRFGLSGDQTDLIGKVKTDGNGAILQRIAVPADAQTNATYYFVVRAADKNSERAVSNPFKTGSGGGTTPTSYTVRTGDNLRGIAARFNTTVAAILRANANITNPGVIYTGQVINLPTPGITAMVTITPRTGSPGTGFFVVAGGFPANQDVDIDIALENGAFKTLLDERTDSTGYINRVVTLPSTAKAGERYVIRVRTTSLVPGVGVVSNVMTVK